MRVLLLCHSFNSLTQRLFATLREQAHEVTVELDISDSVTDEAVSLFEPDLIIASFLKRRICESIWRNVVCLVVHPGPPGDRGPSALDWAILEQLPSWGVTILQANNDFDAGPVWAHTVFNMRTCNKGSIYRSEVTDGAVKTILEVIKRIEKCDPDEVPKNLQLQSEYTENNLVCDLAKLGWRPAMSQTVRQIDWQVDSTSKILAHIRSSDGQPGVLDNLFNHDCHIFDVHAASASDVYKLNGFLPGEVVAQRDDAFLRRTIDGGVWIGQIRDLSSDGNVADFKIPTALAFPFEALKLPKWTVCLEREDDEWAEIRYSEFGSENARIGCLAFDFYNGAMSTSQCNRLLEALKTVKLRDTCVLLLIGGEDFFSNGINLNCIEAAAHRPNESAADESWRNINAMNDVAKEIINMTDRITVSVLRGNAGAGGVFLALAADEVWASESVVLNPHYRNMGNLYGSEYWTYLLPKRLGELASKDMMSKRLPLLATSALKMGLIDRCLKSHSISLEHDINEQAQALVLKSNLKILINEKQKARTMDELNKPLDDYRKEELFKMHRNFYGFDASYHVARFHFVHKLAHAWTPRHLAIHRL